MKRNNKSAPESVRRNWELENRGAYTDPKGNIHFADGTFASKAKVDKKFDEFMKEKLGGPDELQSDETVDGKGDNSQNNEDS